ncbi:Hsp20/alpha crystallin family protein [Patescibacteria group bacterium]|nr:Hsp20/alpha crystallin family protein [Patescibacteria group bacterium]
MEFEIPEWQKHLDDLDKHYDPETFFIDQLSRPTNEPDVREHFFTPTLAEATEISEQGQLTLDVFQDNENIYVIAPVAGVKQGNIDISIDDDILTIQGQRENEFSREEKDYLFRECYWGKFSRSIILPANVNENKIQAILQNGILKITLPKIEKTKKQGISVKELPDY